MSHVWRWQKDAEASGEERDEYRSLTYITRAYLMHRESYDCTDYNHVASKYEELLIHTEAARIPGLLIGVIFRDREADLVF